MSAAWDFSRIGFRLLDDADLPRLYRWLRMPHVQAWWDSPASLEEVRAKYLPRIQRAQTNRPAKSDVEAGGEAGDTRGDVADHVPFVILYDGAAIGYIQMYPVRAGEWGGVAPSDAIGLDLFIGDPAYVHRGLGARIVRRFVREIVFARRRCTRCYVDPVTHNRTAIRAFEEAGFCHVMTLPGVGTGAPVYLMCRERTDATKEGGSTSPIPS